ncbi:MAG: hypothetical protein CSA07_01400 [Bacteroidia bacterium]|nr:MAG: hypothetical protein CSA07_01400 [Bacteroidia bacterium]
MAVLLLSLGGISCKKKVKDDGYKDRLENRWELKGVEFLGPGGGIYSPSDDRALMVLRTMMSTPQVWNFLRGGQVLFITQLLEGGEYLPGTAVSFFYSLVAAQRNELVVTYETHYSEGSYEIGDRSMTLNTSNEQLYRLIDHYIYNTEALVRSKTGVQREEAKDFVKALRTCKKEVWSNGVSVRRRFVYLSKPPVLKT